MKNFALESSSVPSPFLAGQRCLPLVLHGLDVEPEGWADGGGVFAVDFLHDGRFASIVQATAKRGGPSPKGAVPVAPCPATG